MSDDEHGYEEDWDGEREIMVDTGRNER